jgi:hypothetical protein
VRESRKVLVNAPAGSGSVKVLQEELPYKIGISRKSLDAPKTESSSFGSKRILDADILPVVHEERSEGPQLLRTVENLGERTPHPFTDVDIRI